MNDKTPGEPGFLPGTVWTRVDEVGVGDRIFVRHDDDDLWALVTSIEPGDVPERLRLALTLEPDGVPGERCEFTLKKRDVCMCKLPPDHPSLVVIVTSETAESSRPDAER